MLFFSINAGNVVPFITLFKALNPYKLPRCRVVKVLIETPFSSEAELWELNL